MTAPSKSKDARRERLEKALRDNLKRRKTQARERMQNDSEAAQGRAGKLSVRKS